MAIFNSHVKLPEGIDQMFLVERGAAAFATKQKYPIFRYELSLDQHPKDMLENDTDIPICFIYGIFTYIWVISWAHVVKYSIHGAYGI